MNLERNSFFQLKESLTPHSDSSPCISPPLLGAHERSIGWKIRKDVFQYVLQCFYLKGYAFCGRPLVGRCRCLKLSFGRPGASLLAPWGPFWHLVFTPGGPLAQHKGRMGFAIGFSMILKGFWYSVLRVFWAPKVLSCLLAGHFSHRFLTLNLDARGSQNMDLV